jgi:hypothetical protein
VGNEVNQLLSYQTAADLLGCSRALISDLALAALAAAEINAGKRRLDDVPPRLRPYLNLGFPIPQRVGRRLMRLDPAELQAYVKRGNHKGG